MTNSKGCSYGSLSVKLVKTKKVKEAPDINHTALKSSYRSIFLSDTLISLLLSLPRFSHVELKEGNQCIF